MGSCYKHVNDYVQDCTGIVLEIGSDRYEGSSAYFAEIAEQYNKDFVTIDLDENMPRRLKQCIPKHLQDRLIDTWIGDWKTVAGNNGWTGLARVQFVDVAGKQVAYKSRSIK